MQTKPNPGHPTLPFTPHPAVNRGKKKKQTTNQTNNKDNRTNKKQQTY